MEQNKEILEKIESSLYQLSTIQNDFIKLKSLLIKDEEKPINKNEKPIFKVGDWVYSTELKKAVLLKNGELDNDSYTYPLIIESTRLATDDEILKTLTEEAKKRGFKKGVTVKRPVSWKVQNEIIICNDNFSIFNYINSSDCKYKAFQINCFIIYRFDTDEWAEVVKDDGLKILGYKVEKIEKSFNWDKVYEFGKKAYKIGCMEITNDFLLLLVENMEHNKIEEISFKGNTVTIDELKKIIKL